MDGVLTETSRQHYQAWKTLAMMLGITMDETFNERLKGISRKESLEEILSLAQCETNYSEKEKESLMFVKNEYYKQLISRFTQKNLFDGVKELLIALKSRGIKIGIGSASKNASTLIRLMEIDVYVDYMVDPSKIAKGKPEPDIFLDAALNLGVKPGECVGVEDSLAGIEAINRAGMHAIGIGQQDLLVDTLKTYEHIKKLKVEEILCL